MPRSLPLVGPLLPSGRSWAAERWRAIHPCRDDEPPIPMPAVQWPKVGRTEMRK